MLLDGSSGTEESLLQRDFNLIVLVFTVLTLQYTKCLAAFQDTTYKLMFGHFLRSENGKGDTIDRLGSLHLLLENFSSHQRILATAQVAPLLIK